MGLQGRLTFCGICSSQSKSHATNTKQLLFKQYSNISSQIVVLVAPNKIANKNLWSTNLAFHYVLNWPFASSLLEI